MVLKLEDIIEITKNERILKSTWRLWIKNRPADSALIIYKNGKIEITSYVKYSKDIFAIIHFHYVEPVQDRSKWENKYIIRKADYFSKQDVKYFRNHPAKYIGVVYHDGRTLKLNIYRREDVTQQRPKPVVEGIVICEDFFRLKSKRIRKEIPTRYDPKTKEFKEYIREEW